MLNWLIIILAIVFAFNGLWQIRMTLIYMGVLHSNVIGQISSTGSLIHTSLRSALPSLACSAILLFIDWPKFVTYVVGAFALREITDIFIVLLGIGNYQITRGNPKLRLHHIKVQFIVVAIYLIVIAISAQYLGY